LIQAKPCRTLVTEDGLQRVNRLEQLSPPLWRELLPGGEALKIRQGQVA
jgi:hypothetical protein